MSKLFGGGGRLPGSFPRAGILASSPERAKAKEEQLKAIQDREIEAARKRIREAERLRQGRRASILTSSRGVTEPLGTANRPRASTLLGGG